MNIPRRTRRRLFWAAMRLRSILIMRRRIVFAALAVTMATMGAYLTFGPKTYESTAKLRASGSLENGLFDFDYFEPLPSGDRK